MTDHEQHKRRNPERTILAILDSAEKLFAVKGFWATSLAQIGDSAGVSRGTPSYCFGSKAGLYVAVKERLSRNVSEFANEAGKVAVTGDASESDPREILAEVIRSYIGFLAANPNYVRLVEREASGEDAGIEGTSSPEAKMAESLGSFGIEFLEGELWRGPFRQVDARKLAASMIALCSFPFLQNGGLIRTLSIEPNSPEFIEEYTEHVIRLLLDGIVKEESGVFESNADFGDGNTGGNK